MERDLILAEVGNRFESRCWVARQELRHHQLVGLSKRQTLPIDLCRGNQRIVWVSNMAARICVTIHGSETSNGKRYHNSGCAPHSFPRYNKNRLRPLKKSIAHTDKPTSHRIAPRTASTNNRRHCYCRTQQYRTCFGDMSSTSMIKDNELRSRSHGLLEGLLEARPEEVERRHRDLYTHDVCSTRNWSCSSNSQGLYRNRSIDSKERRPKTVTISNSIAMVEVT